MSYYNIKESRGTNGCLISHLLREENNVYIALSPNVSGNDILHKIAQQPQIRLLLDVGALILNLSNEQVATEWLKIDNIKGKNAEAAVYFDENDLKVIDTKGATSFFESSPYKQQLDQCLIYLDDTHTRGTDLKIPKGTVGAVTLGKGVTKDRLMQACMRMRMLGDGHAVNFYASNEIDCAIREKCSDKKVGSLQVIEWAIQNSQTQISEGFLYWAIQGKSCSHTTAETPRLIQ